MAIRESGAVGVAVTRSRRRVSSDQLLGILLVTPALIVIAGILVYPALFSLVISTEKWTLFLPPDQRGAFVGLENYLKQFGSNLFAETWLVTIKFVIVGIVAEYLIGLGMAMIMAWSFTGRGLVRTAFIIPMLLAQVVVAIQWRWLLSGNFGVVYYVLQAAGLNPPIWLADSTWALYMVVVADAWQNSPFIALILLAALQSIPLEIYEAARVDGASALHVFRSITLPLIATASLLAVLMRFGDLIRSFDLIYVMTSGGPGRTTQVVGMYTYLLGFTQGELGQAAAVSVVVAIFSLVAGGLLVTQVRTQTRIV